MTQQISIIVAIAEGNAIGRNGGLLCHLPADMKHFKAVTSGHTVIMGRKTFDSLPKGALPNRRNIVVTRNAAFTAPGVETAGSLEEAFSMAARDGEIFIIGGAQIYNEALGFSDKIYLTKIESVFPDADTFFPEIGNEWQVVDEESHLPDEKNPFCYRFITLVCKNKAD